MALVEIEHATIYGQGSALLNKPYALRFVSSGIPAWLGKTPETPAAYLPWLILVAFGNEDGFIEWKRIKLADQLIEDLPNFLDRFNFRCQPGLSAVVTEYRDDSAGGTATTAQVSAAKSKARVNRLLLLGM